MALNLRLQPSLLVAASVLFAYAPAAFSDIYQWTDEKGSVVYSNIRPRDTSKLKNFKVVMEEAAAPARPAAPPDPEIAAREAALAAQAEALREQELQQRIANLEQQISAMQYSTPPTADASAYAMYGAGYPYPYGYGYSYAVPYAVVVPRFRSPGFRPFMAPRGVPIRAPFHGGGFRTGGGRRR